MRRHTTRQGLENTLRARFQHQSNTTNDDDGDDDDVPLGRMAKKKGDGRGESTDLRLILNPTR